MIHIHHASRFAAVLFVALGATGCASTFSAQIVSCADQKPVPEARLRYQAADGTPRAANTEGEMPQLTGDDGRVRAEVTEQKGSVLYMSIQKEGYESKTIPVTSGKDQTICLNPVK